MKRHRLLLMLAVSIMLYSCNEEPYYDYKEITREFIDTMQIPMPVDTMLLRMYRIKSDTTITVIVNDNLHDSLLITAKIRGTNLENDTVFAYKEFRISNDTMWADFIYHSYRTNISNKQGSQTPMTTPVQERFTIVSATVEIPKGKTIVNE